MASKQIETLYKSLTAEWKQGATKNFDKVEKLIFELKAEFVTKGFAGGIHADADTSLLQMQRETAEISAQLYAAKKDVKGFQRAIEQLKACYADFANTVDAKIGESTAKAHMLGLDLMCLVALNNLPAFHMELERIPTKLTIESPYIAFPIKLEQALVEGAYNKIFLSKANLPSPYYGQFMDILLETVRTEIGNCMEKAYRSLSIKETARLLFLDGGDALQKAKKYGQNRHWTVSPDGNSFVFESQDLKEQERGLDPRSLVIQHIHYAKQLEMIP